MSLVQGFEAGPPRHHTSAGAGETGRETPVPEIDDLRCPICRSEVDTEGLGPIHNGVEFDEECDTCGTEFRIQLHVVANVTVI